MRIFTTSPNSIARLWYAWSVMGKTAWNCYHMGHCWDKDARGWTFPFKSSPHGQLENGSFLFPQVGALHSNRIRRVKPSYSLCSYSCHIRKEIFFHVKNLWFCYAFMVCSRQNLLALARTPNVLLTINSILGLVRCMFSLSVFIVYWELFVFFPSLLTQTMLLSTSVLFVF